MKKKALTKSEETLDSKLQEILREADKKLAVLSEEWRALGKDLRIKHKNTPH